MVSKVRSEAIGISQSSTQPCGEHRSDHLDLTHLRITSRSMRDAALHMKTARLLTLTVTRLYFLPSSEFHVCKVWS